MRHKANMLTPRTPTLLVCSLILSVLVCCTNALPVPSNTTSISSKNATWSKEAILGLVGVLVAILLFACGLASKTIRRWATGTCRLCTRPRAHPRNQVDDPSTRLLQRRAEEWVEFNEWRTYVERRSIHPTIG